MHSRNDKEKQMMSPRRKRKPVVLQMKGTAAQE